MLKLEMRAQGMKNWERGGKGEGCDERKGGREKNEMEREMDKDMKGRGHFWFVQRSTGSSEQSRYRSVSR